VKVILPRNFVLPSLKNCDFETQANLDGKLKGITGVYAALLLLLEVNVQMFKIFWYLKKCSKNFVTIM